MVPSAWTVAALLLLATVTAGAAGIAQPTIAVVQRENLLIPVAPHERALQELVVELDIQRFRIPDDGAVRITGEKMGEETTNGGLIYASSSPLVVLSSVEPGSHFWTFTLIHRNGSRVLASQPATLHVEVVVPQSTGSRQWAYKLQDHERRPKVLFNLPVPPSLQQVASSSSSSSSSHRRRSICFASSSSGLFDGQKKMWLQAIAALTVQSQPWDIHVLAFEQLARSSPFLLALQQWNVSISGIPLEIQKEDLDAHGIQEIDAIQVLLDAFHSEFTNATSSELQTTFQRRVQRLHPQFTGLVWQRIVDAFHTNCAGAVLVFANSRSNSDQLLVHAARAAGVRAVVMELANLDPFPVFVDALVAPSHYALYHPSVVGAVVARQQYVLTTGVNTELFRPPPTPRRRHDHPFTVGYVGRLSTEKSVGLLLEAAHLLSKSCSLELQCPIRVRIIGDGPLRSALEALAKQYGLDNGFVEFTGGIYDESKLVQQIQQQDVVVSPGFQETLGIAPLEAMSCGVPVVGFGSGGVGEYLEHGVNGLALEEPTADAIYGAIMELYNDEPKRIRLGDQARRTVQQRFSHVRGLQQYLALYERLSRP